jgi:cytosine/uracil/thiamine/allantoin permease
VLHHVGFLAGLAFVSGAVGTVLFGVFGLALSIPFLVRLRRRYGTYLAPAIALIVMAVMFSLSALVIGPAISGQ